LFLNSAFFSGAQIPGSPSPDRVNRDILQGYLEESGLPFQAIGESLFVSGGSGSQDSGGAGILVLAVPLACPGEPSLADLVEAPAGGEGNQGGRGGLPLRFAIPLSLIRGAEGSPESEDGFPLPVLAFLGGRENENAGELENMLDGLEAAEDPSPVQGDRSRRIIFYLDIPAEKEGALVFRFAEAPPLGQMLPILRICETLKLPWPFGALFIASGSRSGKPENPGGRVLVRPREGWNRAGREEPAPDAARWGEFFRRYARTLGPAEQGGGNQERNYLVFRVLGNLFVIPELPLALGFLLLGLLFAGGLIFLPGPAPGPAPFRRIRKIPALTGLWICMLVLMGTAFYHLSHYPFYMPALVPAFAARSLRRSFPRYICAGSAIFYLGIMMILLHGR
jgi:hypothetical protein